MSSVRHLPNRIWALITDNNAQSALKILSDIRDGSAWVHNAMAVCWMRLGMPEKACAILMDMVFQNNSVIMRQDSSDVTKLNLATAMLMAGRIDGALVVLNAAEQSTPMKENLKKAILAWKKQQSIWSRIAMFFGIYPDNRPVKFDFSPGQLEVNVKDIFVE